MRREGSIVTAMPLVLVAVGLAVVVGLAKSSVAEDVRSTSVSLIQLIASPAPFDGKRVSLIGFVVVEADHTAVYLHESDAKYGIARNGLWLDVPLPSETERLRFHQRYVLIEGRFNARHYGPHELFSGAIQNIGRFEPLEPRQGPIVPAPH